MPILSVRQFSPLMTQRVSIAHRTGFDNYGKPTFGSDTVYQAAVVGQMRLVRDLTGQQVPARQSIYLMSNLAVEPDDRVTLSTADVGSTEPYALTPPIIAVSRYPFLRGQYATVIHLG